MSVDLYIICLTVIALFRSASPNHNQNAYVFGVDGRLISMRAEISSLNRYHLLEHKTWSQNGGGVKKNECFVI